MLRFIALLACGLALVLAGCGDDEDDSESAVTTAADATRCDKPIESGGTRVSAITAEGGSCAAVTQVLENWADQGAQSPGPEGWECATDTEGSVDAYKCGRQGVVTTFELANGG